MNDRPLPTALREWRGLFTTPTTLVILGSVAALLTILGPFNTGTRLSTGPRFAYWLVMAASTFSVGFVVNGWLAAHLSTAREPLAHALRIGALGLATGLAITPVITALNLAGLGYWPALADWPALLGQYLGIAMIVTVIFSVVPRSGPASAPTSSAVPGADTAMPALLDRLPLDKRGPLVALSAEDHYTRIRTTRGDALLLIRLADAIAETAPTEGLRVHRSHWIATGHVAAASRDGGRAILSMRHGPDIPVSRAHMTAVREAGLLPR